MTPKPVGFQLIARDLEVDSDDDSAVPRWETSAHSQLRVGFKHLLANHAEFQRLHPET